MEQKILDKILSDHSLWLKNNNEGSRANLSMANLDFSSFPLWCGTRNMIVDMKIVNQLLAHICALSCEADEFKTIKEIILPYAVNSHVAKPLGLIKEGKQNE